MTFNPIFKGLTILETKNFEVNQDWEVPIPGFFIVAPKKKADRPEERLPSVKISYFLSGAAGAAGAGGEVC